MLSVPRVTTAAMFGRATALCGSVQYSIPLASAQRDERLIDLRADVGREDRVRPAGGPAFELHSSELRAHAVALDDLAIDAAGDSEQDEVMHHAEVIGCRSRRGDHLVRAEHRVSEREALVDVGRVARNLILGVEISGGVRLELARDVAGQGAGALVARHSTLAALTPARSLTGSAVEPRHEGALLLGRERRRVRRRHRVGLDA